MENSLTKALSAGQLKLAKMLIEGGHNVNFCNSSGVTPLMLACSLDVDDKQIQRKLQLVKYILDRKADLTAVDNIGRTALMYALFSGCKHTIQLIKAHGLVQSVNIIFLRIPGELNSGTKNCLPVLKLLVTIFLSGKCNDLPCFGIIALAYEVRKLKKDSGRPTEQDVYRSWTHLSTYRRTPGNINQGQHTC